MRGRIEKALSGFYYVNVGGGEILTCRARGKFRKEAQVLEKHAERVLADIHPLLHTEISDIVSIEPDDALIVVPIAIDVTTKR